MLLLILATTALALPPQVAAAVSTGDCTAVLSALPSPHTDEERLAAGWCQHRLGRDEQAVATLADLQGVYGEYGRYVRARSLAELDRSGEAADVLEGLVLPGDAGLEVRLMRGRALVQAQRSLEARPGLRELLDTEVGSEARYWLAVGGEDRGATEAAIATYQRVWATSTRGPWAGLAAERLEALGAPVSKLLSSEGLTLAKDRFRALKSDHQAEAAREMLLAIRRVQPAATRSEKLELARVHASAKAYDDAVAAYNSVLGYPEEASGSATELFDYALTTVRSGDYDTGLVIYRRLMAQHPSHDKADFASFKLGYSEYDRGRLDQAVVLLQEHIDARPASPRLDEALWFLGRCRWRQGDTDAAVAAWSRLVRDRPKSSLVPAALYWQARALDGEEEEQALAEVIRRYPTSGHAWFVAQRLGRTWPAKDRVQRPEWPQTLAGHAQVQRGEALLQAGFQRWAAAEWAGLASSAPSHGKDAALAAAHALIAAGDYRTGKKLARPWCVSPWKQGDPLAQQACYPRPAAEVVEPLAREYGLPELVPYAIMTTESALDPAVTSWAGARGLMQVMPAEGERMHRAAFGDARPYDPDDLYQAPYNAALGTTELGMKLKSLDGILADSSLPAVIASYNGGEEAVRRWVGDRQGELEADEFAEDVGYTETRRYVRKVLGYYMAYRWVYGD